MNFVKKLAIGGLGVASCLTAGAELMDRSSGIKIGERMTLRPYVALSLTYDSNVRAENDGHDEDMMWSISPSLALDYRAENWTAMLSAYYNFHQYFKSQNQDYNGHSYGEDLSWKWSNSLGAEKGWSLILGESFKQMTMSDDMTTDDGKSYSSDSRQIQLAAALQRRFNENWHGDMNADYYWLDYMNDTHESAAYYGWDRFKCGMEGGFAPSPWTDILLSGGYQWYGQDNCDNTGMSDTSYGYTFQGGLGSYMTERISYRLLAGWSRFEYGNGASSSDGFVYTASSNWKMSDTWNMMLLATSYYQPSERQMASKSRVDSLSWGLAKSLVRGKLRAVLDLRYRRETNEYAGESEEDYDYVLNVLTGRFGLNYVLNRFLSAYGNIEYQRSFNSEADSRGNAYDYDRWRFTLGLMLTY